MDLRLSVPPAPGTIAETAPYAAIAGPRRVVLTTALKTLLAGLVLWLVIEQTDARRLTAAFTSASLVPLLSALLLVLPNLALQHAKWRLLARRASGCLRERDIALSLFAGFAIGLVTPARSGEYSGRALALPEAGGAVVAGLTGVDKLASLLVTLLAGIASSLLYAAELGALRHALAAGIAIAVLTSSVAVAGLLRLRRRSETGTAPPASRWKEAIRRALGAARLLSRRDLTLLFTLSAAFYAVFIAQFTLLLVAFDGVSFSTGAVGASTAMLLKTVIPPVTLGELGIREGVAVFVLVPLHVAAEAAFNASMFLFGINVLFPAVLGTAVLFAWSGRHGASS